MGTSTKYSVSSIVETTIELFCHCYNDEHKMIKLLNKKDRSGNQIFQCPICDKKISIACGIHWDIKKDIQKKGKKEKDD